MINLSRAGQVALGGLLLSLFAAMPAMAARSEFYGIAQSPNLSPQDIQEMSSAGVRTDRFPFVWRRAEPSEGNFDWTSTDTLIGELAAHGIRSLPFLWGSPDWAGTGGVQRGPATPEAQHAWQDFLRAAVSRYGPRGSYWTTEFEHAFGPNATPLPIISWQIWNEPNLKHFFPGGTVNDKVQRYADLVRISDEAIKGQDPRGRVILGGMAANTFGLPGTSGSDFLSRLYGVSGFKDTFDAAALHPYGFTLDVVRGEIAQFRTVMNEHRDSTKPLSVTEFGWESSDPDGPPAIKRGLEGQATMLHRTYQTFLEHRAAWRLEGTYWYLWRDPPPTDPPPQTCSFCSMGLVTNDGIEKPAFDAFMSLATETTPPVASIVEGPADGGLTDDPTPTFRFTSSEPGSTFGCAFDATTLRPCSSPLTHKAKLVDGTHVFSVEAIDAAGNESTLLSRSFIVDGHAPVAPRIVTILPKSPANNNSPRVRGSAEAGSTVRIYRGQCEGSPTKKGSAAQFASPGLSVAVSDNSVTRLVANATDAAGHVSPCSATRSYVEDSLAPQTTITGGPSEASADSTPTFTFIANEAGSTFRCRFDQQPFAPCSGPGQSETPATPLSMGPHTFAVQATDRAQNTDYTSAKRSFSIIP
jgi:hypothetical protein